MTKLPIDCMDLLMPAQKKVVVQWLKDEFLYHLPMEIAVPLFAILFCQALAPELQFV